MLCASGQIRRFPSVTNSKHIRINQHWGRHWFDSHLEAIVFLLKLPRESYDKEDNNDDDKDDDVDGDNDDNVDNNNVDNDNDDMK